MTREAKIQIKDIVAKFVEELKPKAIYLFGSYARGDYNETSDYDFYIVTPGKKRVSANLHAKAYSCLHGLKRRPIDIIVNNEATFTERSGWLNALEKTILEEGIKLYEKN